MRFGDILVLRATSERVVLLGALDTEGTLLVGKPGAGPFEVHEDDVTWVEEQRDCGCGG